MRFCKHVIIIYNELYKNKQFNEKKLLTIEALLVLSPKNKTFQNFRKNTKNLDFEMKELFPIFFIHPIPHLPKCMGFQYLSLSQRVELEKIAQGPKQHYA